MFNPGLKIGQIVKNADIVEIFKCGNMGGMRRSRTTNTIEQTNGYKVQISFINLQKIADIAINERTYIYDRCTLQLPPGRYSLH